MNNGRTELYLSLGSNLGDREKNVALAISRLDASFGVRRKALSPLAYTEPVGFKGEIFVNAVVLYEVDMARFPALKVLRICKGIEKSLGRIDRPEYDAEGHRIYHDRIIDIDILRYGTLCLDTPRLTIPHPHLAERPFFTEMMDALER